MGRPKIELKGLRKVYGDDGSRNRTEVFSDINLIIDDGEFVSLVGPSGCGKSTTLQCVAGLEPPSSGDVLLDGQRVAGPGPDLGVVFQEYALFPWRRVLKNVEYGLEVLPLSRSERTRRAMEYLELVGLRGFEQYWPHELSGGMRQRVAIARALVMDPKVLLLDEPFGALDALTRKVLQQELVRIWQATRMTVLLVTHSITEAVFLSDRVILLSARPAHLRADIAVDLPRPRDPYDPAFVALQAKLESMVWEDVQMGQEHSR